jgi:hypothetical protein
LPEKGLKDVFSLQMPPRATQHHVDGEILGQLEHACLIAHLQAKRIIKAITPRILILRIYIVLKP